jgi:hypothetical protein
LADIAFLVGTTSVSGLSGGGADGLLSATARGALARHRSSSWRRRWTRCVHFQLGTEHRSDRCGGGHGVPPRELTYPTERLGVQSALTVLALVKSSQGFGTG